ncbi:hypothetical protein [Euzebya tangerina]|uniref:hypothetical protein n=1 Tax=Euzebya tangerina TaxID=591198 RepID=UPI000E316DB2|nr:hypothetical protein [Euzebya tangerina]
MDEVERLRSALALHDAGVALMRQNLRRRHPDEDEEQIAARLRAWLRTRPGAEYGDTVGTPRVTDDP